LFRIRETHVARHLAPLIRDRAYGAAKLDLVIRGIALPPGGSGRREPGTVLPRITWEQIHDLARELPEGAQDRDPAEQRRLKRKWVGNQLRRLEAMKLIPTAPTTRGTRPPPFPRCPLRRWLEWTARRPGRCR
jgi:hypothetical protein